MDFTLNDRQQIVFVGGLHRSGTSLLARQIGRHPDASSLRDTGVSQDEGQFLQDVYLRDSQLGGAGSFAFDPRAHTPPCTDPAAAAIARARLLAAWAPHWAIDRRLLVEKTPGNLLNARYLQSLFGAQASFVFITRHPLVTSMATRKWSRTSLFALMEHWLCAHEALRAQAAQLRRVAWISYEGLVADPVGTLAQLRAFLGQSPIGADDIPAASRNGRYLASWHRHYLSRVAHLPPGIQAGVPVRATVPRQALWRVRAQLRRSLLNAGLDLLSTGREAASIVAHHEARVRAFGYSLVDTGLCPAPPLLRAPGVLSSFAIGGLHALPGGQRQAR